MRDLDSWFARRTYRDRPTPSDVAGLAAGHTVSVVIPARDEEATIAGVVTAVRTALDDVVDEVLVVDSRSRDTTARLAAEAGARVVPADDGHGPDGGKGRALRTGLTAMRGEFGVFLDADVTGFDAGFVTGLLAPLLADDLVLVKGFYDRPWTGDGPQRTGGGRVTELVARPLIARHAPALAGFAQPLAGEVAFQREALRRLSFVSGYGVDIGLLLSVLDAHGLDAMGQADLGVRRHRHQGLEALGRMALQVEAAFALARGEVEEVVATRTSVVRDAHGRPLLHRERVTTRLLP